MQIKGWVSIMMQHKVGPWKRQFFRNFWVHLTKFSQQLSRLSRKQNFQCQIYSMGLLHFSLSKKIIGHFGEWILSWIDQGYLMGCLPWTKKMSENEWKSVFCKLKAEFQTWHNIGWDPESPDFSWFFEYFLTRFGQQLARILKKQNSHRQGFIFIWHFVPWNQQLQTHKKFSMHKK